MGAFLDTVNIVSIAIILSVIVEMGRATLLDCRTMSIALLSIAFTFYFKEVNSAFIILGGALLGYILSLF
jgi:chromate transporter